MGFPRLLPFERGTAMQGDSITAADDDFKHVVGRCFSVKDTENGTPHDVVLRVVQIDTRILKSNFRKGFKFAITSTGDFGSHLTGGTTYPTTGQFGKPLDDAYHGLSTGFAANSVIYVVDEGPCDVLSEADSHALLTSVGTGVTIGGSGLYEHAVDGDVVSGTIMRIAATTAASTSVIVYVVGGLDPSPAGAATS